MDLDWSIIENPERKWHEDRKRTIGSSDMPIIMGLSPYKTALDLWKLKTGLVEPEKQNFAQARGTEMEPIAREWFNNKTGLNFKPKAFKHKERERFTASLDGWDEETRQAVEIKFSGSKDHLMAKAGTIPPHYMAQCQWQYIVSGAVKIFYLSYQHDDSVILEVPKPNKQEIEHMLYVAESFLELVDHKQMPALSDKDEMVLDSSELIELAKEYELKISLINEQQKLADEIKEKLIEAAKAAGHKKVAIGNVSITKSTRKGSIDTSKWQDAEKYRKPDTEYYVVRL